MPADAIVPSDYTVEGVRASLGALYADPKIDLVIALGLIASQEAAMRDHRPKPTFAPFPVDVETQSLPYVDGVSGVPNFNYLAANISTRHSIKTFHDLVPFRYLALLVNAELARAVPGFTSQAQSAAKDFGVRLDVIPVGNSVGDALAALGPAVDAVVRQRRVEKLTEPPSTPTWTPSSSRLYCSSRVRSSINSHRISSADGFLASPSSARVRWKPVFWPASARTQSGAAWRAGSR